MTAQKRSVICAWGRGLSATTSTRGSMLREDDRAHNNRIVEALEMMHKFQVDLNHGLENRQTMHGRTHVGEWRQQENRIGPSTRYLVSTPVGAAVVFKPAKEEG